MKAVHFGAGNIGRGFIGMMLVRSGYEVIFVARNEKKVSLLQEQKQYKVTLANDAADSSVVGNVTALNRKSESRIAEEVARADLVTTAVGVTALKHIAAPIARGIELRMKRNSRPLHVIACENAIGGSTLLKKWVYPHLDKTTIEKADRYVAFPDAAVDRIVPVQQSGHPLNITVEPFCEWIVDRSALIDGFRGIEGVKLVDKLEPYIERKLFTVNSGHCTAAYYGYLAGKKTIQEAMRDDGLKKEVEAVLRETGRLLVAKHGMDEGEHRDYIRKTMERFANPNLTDDIARVGRCPARKLTPNERLVRPAMEAVRLGLPAGRLAAAIAAALCFDYAGDAQAVKLQAAIKGSGLSEVIRSHLRIPDGHPLHALIVTEHERLQRSRAVSSPVR